jgi:hypothetical protein
MSERFFSRWERVIKATPSMHTRIAGEVAQIKRGRALPISKAQLRDAARILQEYDEWARKTAAAALSKANPPENETRKDGKP